jgi:hypothetical protein
MELPAVPKLEELASISPSFYNTALSCKAKAGWFRFAPPGAFPGTTGAILGGCFHAVMEIANRGRLPAGAAGATRAKAEFDAIALELFAKAHPLLRAKFRSPAAVPYYHQRRARAVEMALRASSGATIDTTSSAPSEVGPPTRSQRMHIEKKLTARDGFVTGRIDLLDEERRKIIDYKSGHAPREGASSLAENEVRQLHLYAHLARENGYDIAAAAIVRGDGTEAAMNVSPDKVAREADAARTLRSEFNIAAAAGKDLAELAMPAPEICAGCPCLPACEPFWAAATPQWEEACGTNAEGMVTEMHSSTVSGTELVTLTIDASRGSAPRGVLIVEQIPSRWLAINGDPPLVGESVRIVQAARLSPTLEKEVRALRVDRFKSTAVWHVASPALPI